MNFTMLAQNSTDVNYVQQACVSAMSIRHTNPTSKICLITNDKVPSKYKELFDAVVEIPWGDSAHKYEWKIHNRFKIIHACPFKDTVVIDTDMLILNDLSNWQTYFEKYDFWICNNVKTYRDEIANNQFYRKKLNKFKLPNVYYGLHYFKKSKFAYEFYGLLDIIVNNYNDFFNLHNMNLQNFASMDISSSLATAILDCESIITSNSNHAPMFTHMKANIQNWQGLKDSWQKEVGTYLTDDAQLYIGNYKQNNIFHYTEDDFITNDIIETYEKIIGI